MEIRKIDLFIDFDDVLVCSTIQLLKLMNKEFGTKFKVRDTRKYSLTDIFPNLTHDDILDFMNKENFFHKLKKQRGMIKVLKKINKYYNYHIATLGDEENLRLKEIWCNENLPFEFKFIGVTDFEKKKSTIDMSYGIFIDDNVNVLDSTNATLKILFDQIERDTTDIRKSKTMMISASNWKEIYRYLDSMRIDAKEVVDWKK